MRHVTISADARSDLRIIKTWISADSPRAALRLINRIEFRIAGLDVAAERFSHHPSVGPPLRRFVEHPYLVFFEVAEKTVLVVAVLHGARQLSEVLSERARLRR